MRCTLNGEVAQDGYTFGMVFSVARPISYPGSAMTPTPGDLVVTGTSAGASQSRSAGRPGLVGTNRS